MAAIRITSGPLRGVELETALGEARRGRALRLRMRAARRRWTAAAARARRDRAGEAHERRELPAG
ncbi:hypothetical protein [Miltoncostaea marina]|uniref:hypothetical protein n=1 Tax=Miltoncostaea marina TaxID=2843215 RepID=UPI001C3C7292|nr:hypothetical protein [Miltoncostaea marina]